MNTRTPASLADVIEDITGMRLLPTSPLPRARRMTAAEYEAIVDAGLTVIRRSAEAILGEGRANTVTSLMALDVALQPMPKEDEIARMIGALRDYLKISPTSEDPDDLYDRSDCMAAAAVVLGNLAENLMERSDAAAKMAIELSERADEGAI